jgi:hypothetical protein
MAIQFINTGSSANAGDGDSIRSAFAKINNNFTVLTTATSSSGVNISTGDTPPVNPALGDLWYDTVSGRTYIYYDSGWVDSSPPGAVGPTGPSGPPGPYSDSVYNAGGVSGTIAFDRSSGTVHTCLLQGNLTISNILNKSSGDNFTIILTQDSVGGRTLTMPNSYKFALGIKSLSTSPGAIDMINMMFIGTTTYVTLTTGYS